MDLFKNKRFLICVTLGVLIISSQILENYYVINRQQKEHIPYDINNNQVVETYFDDNLFKVSTARGYYGMVNSSGREIISPIWNSVEVLSENRFIVGRILDSATISMGILDSYENIVIPMIFSNISQVGEYFLVGTLTENGKKILFDKLGNIELNQEWDRCDINGNTAILQKGNICATVVADNNGNCQYSSITIPLKIFNQESIVTIKNPINDGVSLYDDYSTVVKNLGIYCEAMFNSDTEMVRSVTNTQYYNSLISNMLPDCTLKSIDNVFIYGRESREVGEGVIYNAEIEFSYSSKTTVLDNPSHELNSLKLRLQFIRNTNGDIILKSVNKLS